MQEENNKYKFHKKNAESGFTEIKSNYSRKKTEKKILNSGGTTTLQFPTFFNENNKVELSKFFRIEHLFDDHGDFPVKKTVEDFMKTNLSKKEYDNLTKTANDYQKLARSANIDFNKDSSLDKVSNKFLIKTKEKIRGKAYEILTARKGENDLRISRKWEKNYGLTPNKSIIEKRIKQNEN